MFTNEHRQLAESLQTFIDRELNPHVDQWEDDGIIPLKPLYKKLGDAGFLGISKPAEYGGMGLDYSYSIVAAETLGGVHCGGVPMAIGTQTDLATPSLAKHGSDEVCQEFLVPSIAGDVVSCIAVSEPWAGSDVAGIRTYARTDGDDYVINGTKMWTTNGTQADWMCLLANTAQDGPVHKNKTLICVPMNLPGISTAPRFKKLGMQSSDTTQIFIEDVRVPRRNRIGEEGRGFIYQMEQFQEERLFGAASSLKQYERLISLTRDYACERTMFGARLIDQQVVAFRLAELECEVELLRSLIYRAVEAYIGGEDVTRLATMAKLKMGQIGIELPSACLQFWGGNGYMWESPVARAFRDCRLGAIAGGANEVMLHILSKMALKDAGRAKPG